MRRRATYVIAGAALVCVFLAWAALKGTEPVHAWLDAMPVWGVVVWGLAWLTMIAGAALISLGLRRQQGESMDV